MRMTRRLLGPLILTLLASWIAPARGLAAPPGAREFHFSKLNRIYDNLAGATVPVDMSPIKVLLSSSHERVLVKDNSVHLQPLGGDRFAGSVDLDLLGEGHVVADVDLAGQSQRLTDEVLLPPQRVSVAGVVRLSRAAGGYRIVTEKLPPSVRVSIRSHVVDQLLDTCSAASLISLGSLDCKPVAEALQRPEVPLPGPGSQFFLSDDDLTPGDRQALDALLAGH